MSGYHFSYSALERRQECVYLSYSMPKTTDTSRFWGGSYGKLADIVIQVGTEHTEPKSFSCHKVVLSLSSSYFFEVFGDVSLSET